MLKKVISPLREDVLLNNDVVSQRYITYFEQLSNITNTNLDDVYLNKTNILINSNHIADNTTDIATNTTNIATNTTNIATNVTDITDINNELGDLIVITANYTTIGTGRIICNNSSNITITLNASPVDDEKVYIKQINNEVLINGNGNNIDGDSTLNIDTQYMTYLLCYSSTLSNWFII